MPFKKRAGVYKIINTTSNKVYIGSSVNVNLRKSCHFSNLKKGIHKNKKLQNSFNTYGESAFVFEVLEYVEDEGQLLDREQYYINLFDSVNKGYNILEYAANSLGYKHTAEVRLKLSERQMGEKNHFWGKHLTPEHKANISAGNKGKKHSKEAVDRTREGHFKPIVNVETKEKFTHISAAAKKYGVSVAAISNVLKGKSKTCCGHHWRYLEEQNELS